MIPDMIASTSDADTDLFTSATADASDTRVGLAWLRGLVEVSVLTVVVSNVVGMAVVKVLVSVA